MIGFVKKYHNNILLLINSIKTTGRDKQNVDFYQGIEMACELIIAQKDSGNKIIFIGNGASAAMSSHMSTDFWKNGGIRAIAFNDSSLLTCIANDFGYKYVFEKPIEMFADKGDVLIVISSSGKSENIVLGVDAAKSKGCKVITLSGFDENNSLSQLGDLNFYVGSNDYGPVETIHQYICHLTLDTIIEYKKRSSGIKQSLNY